MTVRAGGEGAPTPAGVLPWYHPVGDEVAVFEHCYRLGLPLALKGPTGCGKSRFVAHMAARLGRPLVTVAAHDDTSAVDLVGRYLVEGGHTRWSDGPVTRAVREGAILYVDEVAEARSDVVVVLHPLADHRRALYVDRRDEELIAAPGFLLVVSFNPGYQRSLKDLKPSTRQRFVSLTFGIPAPNLEAEIVVGESGIDLATARRLVAWAGKVRAADTLGLVELPSTRLLVAAARLVRSGLAPRRACRVACVEPLTDEPDTFQALAELVDLVFDRGP